MRRAPGEARKAAPAPTSSISTSSPSGERARESSSNWSNSLSPDGCASRHRPGRDRVHPDAPGTQLGSQVPHRGLEGRLDRPHHVVVGHDLGRSLERHRQQSAPLGHEWCRQPGHPDERVAGDIDRGEEARQGTIEQAALQVFLGSERDRMQGDVEAAPRPSDLLEDGLELTFLLYVQGQEDRCLEFPGQRLDVGTSLVVQVGDRQLGALLAEGPRTAVGDRVDRWRCQSQVPFIPESGRANSIRHGMVPRVTSRVSRSGMPGDHEFLVGRDRPTPRPGCRLG